ncbi:helix-turn-helix domain-containing protein [Magnetovibrio sp. PR-2]|uniref:helix-turn-helix domain-containing protein n=1 Tax=Magnetovibrio sp. PR-2 TaxID=3120356 RepID=UPI002FCE302C
MTNKTVKQFAESLEVHPNTIYAWIDNGDLPCLKVRGVIRIRPCDEDEFNKRCTFDGRDAANDTGEDELVEAKSSLDAFEKGVRS